MNDLAKKHPTGERIIRTKTLKAMPFGGRYVFTEFLHQIGFYKRFIACFEKLRKVRQSSPSQNVALLAGMIIAGVSRSA